MHFHFIGCERTPVWHTGKRKCEGSITVGKFDHCLEMKLRAVSIGITFVGGRKESEGQIRKIF